MFCNVVVAFRIANAGGLSSISYDDFMRVFLLRSGLRRKFACVING